MWARRQKSAARRVRTLQRHLRSVLSIGGLPGAGWRAVEGRRRPMAMVVLRLLAAEGVRTALPNILDDLYGEVGTASF